MESYILKDDEGKPYEFATVEEAKAFIEKHSLSDVFIVTPLKSK